MTKQAFEDILADDEDMALMCFVQPAEADTLSTEGEALGVVRGARVATPETKSHLVGLQHFFHKKTPLSMTKVAAAPCSADGPAAVKIEDHELFELLLETYQQSVSTVQNSIDLLRSELTNGEQFHILRLTTARNKLLTASLIFTIVAMCTGIGSFVGSIFGMNLASGLEETEGLFNIIAVVASFIVVFMSLSIYLGLRWAGVLASEMG